MKKIILGLVVSLISLFADVARVVPYVGNISYSDNVNESYKESSSLLGVYANVGNLSYLLEGSYGYIDTTYKKASQTGLETEIPNLTQHDISLAYSSYYANFMFKLGGHYIATNDLILDDGVVAIVSLGGYNYVDYDKYSYGLNFYYSYYNKGRNENSDITDASSQIGIIQYSPYFSYFKSISYTMSNFVSLEFNYQTTEDYIQKEYYSYGISDTFYYKSLFIELSGYLGEMRSGVKDGGMSVFNSLDLQKNGVKSKLGYYLSKDFIVDLSYAQNTYVEYALIDEAKNEIYTASVNYRF